MAHRNYLIRYSNGFKEHISHADLLARTGLVKVGHRAYLSTVSIQEGILQSSGPNYLPGLFLWQLAELLEYERLQTSKGQIQQLEKMGWRAESVA